MSQAKKRNEWKIWICTLFLMLSGLGIASPAQADLSFETAVNYSVGTDPFSVVAGDFNGDGKLDLAVAIFNSNNVSILLGSGNGTFQAAVNYIAGSNPRDVIAGDFNGDGKLDLAVANQNGNNVSILLGIGDGTFQSIVNYAVGSLPVSLTIGDFNGDGKLDLTAANNSSNNVSVLLGNGDGTFQGKVNYGVGNGPASVFTGDFNGDGKPDLATANYGSSNVSILLGIGDGTFQAAVNYAAGANSHSVTAGDFNGDGKLDLSVANYSSSNVSILLGVGDGTFNAAGNYAVRGNPCNLTTGDFNGDGKLDLAVVSRSEIVSILPGNGDGTFQTAAEYVVAGFALSFIATGDFNGDSKLDLAAAQYGGSNAFILLNNSTFDPADGFKPAVNYGAGGQRFAVTSNDFNRDGKLDLAVANYDSNNVSILLGNGDGTFQTAVNYGAGSRANFVATGDFNKDGKADIVVANRNSNNVSVLLGNGDGTFTPAVNYGVGTGPVSVSAGDFNGDGKADLAVANADNSSVSILLGNGDGTFQGAVNYGAGTAPISLTNGDFNRDGKIDLAVANWTSNNVSILLGNGDGTFQGAVNYATVWLPSYVAAGDFNRDGKLDLAVMNYGTGTNNVSILLGNGDGTFQAAVNYGAGDSGSTIAVDDFNRDGIPDLAATYNYCCFPYDNDISILLGNGDGTFSEAVYYAVGDGTSSVTTGDFNGDGKPDLAAANRGSNNVSILLNTAIYIITASAGANGNISPSGTLGVYSGDNQSFVITPDACYHVADVLVDGVSQGAITSYQFNNVTADHTLSANFAINTYTITATAGANGSILPSGSVGVNCGSNQFFIITPNTNYQVADVLVDGSSVGPVTNYTLNNVTANHTIEAIFETLLHTVSGRITQAGSGLAGVTVTLTGAASTSTTTNDSGDYSFPGLYNGNYTVTPHLAGYKFVPPPRSVLVSGVDVSGQDFATWFISASFQDAVNYGVATNPYSLATADFNGDGKLDLAAANYNGNNISILVGSGNGAFQAAVNYAAGSNPVSVTIGDFNRDGKLDLAVANSSTNNVSILLGNGDGTFQAAVNYAAGSAPWSIASGDFNRDGKRDLAVANYNGNNISILLGNGNGTFQAAANYAVGSVPVSLTAGDFNGDGKLDLAVANEGSNDISVLLGNGDGTFQTAVNCSAGAYPYFITSGDFDRDGKLDLAVTNIGSNRVSVLLGNGNGTFQASRYYEVGTSPISVAAGDFDGDGKLDLSVANYGSNNVSLLLGYGDGSFVTPAVSVGAGSSPISVATGDFNGDGKLDLSVANYGGNNISILLNSSTLDPDNTFRPAVNYGTGSNPHSVSAGDFNGDGKLDLAMANYGSDNISLLLGSGDGTFQAAVNYGAGDGPISIVSGDFNGDGKLDLAVANRMHNNVSILLGNGNGTFQSAVNYGTGFSPHSVTAGDFNRDGKLDLAMANLNNNNVSVLLGNGNGTFQAAVNYGTGNNPLSVITCDFNGDGRLDLAVANRLSNSVSILLGNGDGTFQAAVNYAAGSGPYSVTTGDLNNDGKPDLAVANESGNNISILLGNGNGTFQAAVNYAAGSSPHSIAAGDFNRDGKLDLAAANYNGNNFSILLGNGNGTFQAAVNYAAGSGPQIVATGDFDGDSKLDLSVGNYSGSNVSVLINTAMYTVTATAGPNGSISPSGSVQVVSGNDQAFTIIPDTGNHVVDVLVDGVSQGAITNYTFTNVTANHTISATFTTNTYLINAAAGAHGSITPSGDVIVNYGSSQSFTITPSDGYHVADVLVDGVSQGAITSYQFNNVTTNHTISVSFAVIIIWTELSPSGGPPQARGFHSAVFDPESNRMILFGGRTGQACSGVEPLLNDVWVLENADGIGGSLNWTQLATSGTPPSARGFHSAVYDPVNDRMIVFGGDPNIGNCWGRVNDVWVLSDASGLEGTPTWVQLTPAGSPPGVRGFHSAIYDPSTNRMTIFGGSQACGPFLNDAWVLENANGLGGTPAWTQLSPSGSLPTGRTGHTAVYDQTTNRMIVFGGSAPSYANDLWVLENANGLGGTPAWVQLSPSGGQPPARISHTAVYDPISNRMILFGGNTASGPANDFWVLKNANGFEGTPNWVQLFSTGALPEERDSHSATYNPVSNRMTVFAGKDTTCYFRNDLWVAGGYIITATAGANGTISPSGTVSVFPGGNQSFAITPDPGFHVVEVLVDGSPVGAVISYEFNNVIATHTISVSFAIDTYTISASAGANGSISPSGPVAVNHGSNQTFAITPDTGYHVADVLVDGVSQGPILNYQFNNVTASHTISASFALNAYTITATAGANGSISPSGAVTVNHGSNQSFTITPSAGYHVADVLADGSSAGRVTSYEFTNVTANHTISVTFAIDIYAITATAGANGSISPSGAVAVNHGSNQSFTITPSAGYHVADVLADGSSVGSVTSYEFTNVTTNHTISVSFIVTTSATTPTGVTNAGTGNSYAYSTSGSPGGGHPAEFQFDWKGDESDLSPWGSSSQTKSWSAVGAYTVRARARCALHTSAVSDWSAGLRVVVVNPTFIDFKINNGAGSTISSSVTLTYITTGNPKYIRTSIGGAWSSWRDLSAITPPHKISLGSTNGIREVFAQLKDDQGSISAVARASIFLDTIAPIGVVRINGGTTSVANGGAEGTPVRLHLAMFDANMTGAKMRIKKDVTFVSPTDDNLWEDFTAGKDVTLTVGTGTRRVYVQFKDGAGKTSAVYPPSINVVAAGGSPWPGVSGVTVNDLQLTGGGRATYSVTTNVTLSCTLADYTGLSARFLRTTSDGTVWTSWQLLTSNNITKLLALSTANGHRQVYIQLRENGTGKMTDPQAATIILDTIVPTGVIQINNGGLSVPKNTASVTLTTVANDCASGIDKMAIYQTGETIPSPIKPDDARFQDFAPTVAEYALNTSTIGTKTVYIWIKDKAGKISAVMKDTISIVAP